MNTNTLPLLIGKKIRRFSRLLINCSYNLLLLHLRFVALTSCLGCALFSKLLGLNAVLVELDELSSGVPSFLKSDHGKLLHIAILCLVTWVSRGTCVMVS